MYQCCFNIT